MGSLMKTLMAGCAVILFFAACRSGQGVSSGGSVKEDTGDYRVAERMDTMPFHMVAPFRSEFELQTGFKPFPRSFAEQDMVYLIDAIIPDVPYKYWECVRKRDEDMREHRRGSVIVYNGDSAYASVAEGIYAERGFFIQGHFVPEYSFIVGVKDRNQIDLINSDRKLVSFIGRVDNLEEAVLIAEANGYGFDPDTLIGGAYKERANDYLLYLMEVDSWPETYKSVRAILTKDGHLTVLDKVIYRQTDIYIME